MGKAYLQSYRYRRPADTPQTRIYPSCSVLEPYQRRQAEYRTGDWCEEAKGHELKDG